MRKYKRWASECVKSYRPNEKTKYLFDGLLNPPERNSRLGKAEIQSETEDLLIAGSDTTATTLTYACMHLARDPELWEQLHQEILPFYKDDNTIPRSRDLENLPLLTACLKESELQNPLSTHHSCSDHILGLRLATPVPVPVPAYLWRIVPPSPSIHYEVRKHVLPTQASIGMSAWNVHYDATIFPSSEAYKPSR